MQIVIEKVLLRRSYSECDSLVPHSIASGSSVTGAKYQSKMVVGSGQRAKKLQVRLPVLRDE
jgi:hypothetical protein